MSAPPRVENRDVAAPKRCTWRLGVPGLRARSHVEEIHSTTSLAGGLSAAVVAVVDLEEVPGAVDDLQARLDVAVLHEGVTHQDRVMHGRVHVGRTRDQEVGTLIRSA